MASSDAAFFSIKLNVHTYRVIPSNTWSIKNKLAMQVKVKSIFPKKKEVKVKSPNLNASPRLERDNRVPLPWHAVPPCRTDPPPNLFGVLSRRTRRSYIAWHRHGLLRISWTYISDQIREG